MVTVCRQAWLYCYICTYKFVGVEVADRQTKNFQAPCQCVAYLRRLFPNVFILNLFLCVNSYNWFSCSPDSASKHAVQGYFDALRCELAPKGIRVVVVSPGYIKTDISLNALTGEGNRHGQMDGRIQQGMSPLGAAQAVMQAVAEGKRELVLAPLLHQLAVYLRVLCPSVLDWILIRRKP